MWAATHRGKRMQGRFIVNTAHIHIREALASTVPVGGMPFALPECSVLTSFLPLASMPQAARQLHNRVMKAQVVGRMHNLFMSNRMEGLAGGGADADRADMRQMVGEGCYKQIPLL